MENKQREKSNCSIYCEIAKTQFLEKFNKKELFTTKKINPSLEKTPLTLIQMDKTTKDEALEILDRTSEINKDFCNLKSKFVSNPKEKINLFFFKN